MKLTTEPYFVAYLDLLGGVSLIEHDEKDENLNLILQLYETAKNTKNLNDLDFKSLEVKIFSDNIIIAQKISDVDDMIKQYIEIQRLNCFVSLFVCLALEKTLLFRGGITKGNFIINDTLVWGKALVRAHKLEDNIAIYPRIIIDDCVIEGLPKFDDSDEEIAERLGRIATDFDGLFFLDYLSISTSLPTMLELANEICNKKMAEIQKVEAADKVKIQEKFEWLKRYIKSKQLNNMC